MQQPGKKDKRMMALDRSLISWSKDRGWSEGEERENDLLGRLLKKEQAKEKESKPGSGLAQ